ncbi:DUF2283 domain-containing protein [Almyronema epifaneia]|uniref:DUF2283 domain-containing protein n=1 Tax=Almyronema epifaneia S1 TaxID=2991925 RepID=A0ABW6ICM3_9CYAN
MKVQYDPDADVMRIIFQDVFVEETAEEIPGIVFDFDQDGIVVGIEILKASQRIDNPHSIEYTACLKSLKA